MVCSRCSFGGLAWGRGWGWSLQIDPQGPKTHTHTQAVTKVAKVYDFFALLCYADAMLMLYLIAFSNNRQPVAISSSPVLSSSLIRKLSLLLFLPPSSLPLPPPPSPSLSPQKNTQRDPTEDEGGGRECVCCLKKKYNSKGWLFGDEGGGEMEENDV